MKYKLNDLSKLSNYTAKSLFVINHILNCIKLKGGKMLNYQNKRICYHI